MLVISRFLIQAKESYQEIHASKLYNENSFYPAFVKDLNMCKNELIIESPFITNRRLSSLLPVLKTLQAKKVRIVINTRDPIETDDEYQRNEAYRAVSQLQHAGVRVLYTKGLHRKLAIIDRSVMYEGSLNILSQNDSAEIMRRISSKQLVDRMVTFIGLRRYI
jgi:phosphatidylserine/phosphatidylglycerophosphate/cardiolipin synthase-like enzyme